MTIQDLGALGELIGSVAVLATLIYLTMQTRQNTRAIAAQVDAARINASLSINISLASSAEMLKAMVDRHDQPERGHQRRIAARLHLPCGVSELPVAVHPRPTRSSPDLQ